MRTAATANGKTENGETENGKRERERADRASIAPAFKRSASVRNRSQRKIEG